MSASKEDLVDALAALVLLVPLMLWDGLVLSKLWGWFMVSQFSLPAIGVAQSIGMAAVVWQASGRQRSPKNDDPMLPRICWGFVSGGWLLLVGYIVKCCL